MLLYALWESRYQTARAKKQNRIVNLYKKPLWLLFSPMRGSSLEGDGMHAFMSPPPLWFKFLPVGFTSQHSHTEETALSMNLSMDKDTQITALTRLTQKCQHLPCPPPKASMCFCYSNLFQMWRWKFGGSSQLLPP